MPHGGKIAVLGSYRVTQAPMPTASLVDRPRRHGLRGIAADILEREFVPAEPLTEQELSR